MLTRCCLGLLLLVPTLAHSATYYVTQRGSDSNPGSQTAPFATIQRCATLARAGDTCQVASGTYRETVTPASDGVTFLADGTVVVSGADLVTNWRVHQGSIYKSSSMNWTMGTGWNQVFVDGVMVNLARWPNASLNVSRPTWAKADGGEPSDMAQADGREFFPWVITDDALTQADGFWVGAEVTLMASGMYSQAGVVTGSRRGRLEFRNLHGTQSRPLEAPYGINYPYYLSNVLGALDTAGEWYFDGTTTLYLWTPTGDTPETHIIEAKRRLWAFELSGRSTTTIKGFAIFAASINMDARSTGNVIDGLDATYVWHQLRNLNTDIAYDAKWGAWNTGIRLAGRDNVLKNCTIAYSSGNGVYMRHTHQTVDNCTIHDVAYLKVEGGAVSWMGDNVSGTNTTGHVVTNSTLYTSGRHLINHYYAPNILVSHNVLYDACIQVGDCGFTYTSKGGSGGEISYNIMHDNRADYWVFGIYMDAIPQNYTLHHNVVYNVPGGICINVGTPASNIKLFNNTAWGCGNNYGIVNAGSMTNVLTYNNLVKSGIAGTDTRNNLESANPGFVNAGAGNFQLQSNSPAINAGRVISGVTDGYSGSAPDIGAYEYGKPAWVAGAGSGSGTNPVPAPKNLRLISQQ